MSLKGGAGAICRVYVYSMIQQQKQVAKFLQLEIYFSTENNNIV